MAEKENPTSVDPDLARLQAKSKQGALNVIGDVLADPKIQQTIKNALLRETVKNSVILACLLMGFFKIYDVAKLLIGFNWIGDLIMSIILILVGLIYLLQNMRMGKPNGDSTTNNSSSSLS